MDLARDLILKSEQNERLKGGTDGQEITDQRRDNYTEMNDLIGRCHILLPILVLHT